MRDSRGRTAIREALSRPPTSPNRAAVLHLLASCSKARLTVNLANWIRVARHERNQDFLDNDSSDDEEDDDMVYFCVVFYFIPIVVNSVYLFVHVFS